VIQSQRSTDLENFRIQWNLELSSRHPGRRPLASSPSSNSLPPGQTTIITTLNGGLAIRPTRPGPLPKPRNLPIPPIQCQMSGGPQERSVISLFESIHTLLHQGSGQYSDEDGELPEFRTRTAYSRAAKLQAIQYANYTWIQTANGSLLPL
jgi:hypothetical protein